MSKLGIIAVLPLRGISYLNTTHPSTIIYNLSTTPGAGPILIIS
jgi:hypothetical protein